MPRIPCVEPEAACAEVLSYYQRDEERYGVVLNNTKIYAHNLPILRGVKALVGHFGEAQAIELTLKSLVRVRIASLNGCPF
jgi:hypothetical protein